MESFQDQGIVLSARGHGENGAIVSLMTEGQGRVAGYVRGATGSKMRGTLEVGNRVDAAWQSRVSDGLGTYSLELCRNYSAPLMADSMKLGALQAACALVDRALPEREAHAGLYHGLLALFEVLQEEVWGQAYVMWEIALLKELGFSLDLSACAGGGDGDLVYVSPKTGRAVSRAAGAPYKEKLMDLPGFLAGRVDDEREGDVFAGLKMTGYFLEHWVFNHHSHGVPEARVTFQARMEQDI